MRTFLRTLLLSVLILSPFAAYSQTHTFPATDTNNVFTGNETHLGTETFSGPLILSTATGSAQCIHVNSSGVFSGTGSDCIGSNPSFASISGATNTSANMIVGSGASISVSGSGSIGATTLNGATFASPGAIGGTSAGAAAFTTVSATGQVTSTLSTGTAPFVVASTTNVANLNAALLNGATFSAPGAIGGGTPAAGAFTTVSASGQITSTLSTGTAPFVVASTTVVANLNASALGGATFAAPGAIGGTTPAAATFTTISATGQITSTLSTGTAPLVIASTTNVPNLNASSLSGATFAAPGAIGGGTPAAITGTTVTANTSLTINGGTAVTKILSATATLNFGNLVAIGCEDLTITVTGAVDGDTVALGVPNGSVASATFTYTGWVSAADTVTLRGCALVSGDPASGTFRATVIRF